MPRILVFAGSTRTDSLNRKLARAAATVLLETGAEVTLADLRDYPMPLYDGDIEASQGLPDNAKTFKELLREHDAFVIASPEYNGFFPALVKNVLDWASRPEPGEGHLAVFRGKTAAILSASPGSGGGQRGLRHLSDLLQTMGVTVIPEQVTLPRASAAFDADSSLVRPETAEALGRQSAALLRAIDAARTMVA